MKGKIFQFVGKFLLFYLIFFALWYVSIPVYNYILSDSLSFVLPVFDGLDVIEYIKTEPKIVNNEKSYINQFLLAVRIGKELKGLDFDGARFHFNIIILAVLVFSTLPVSYKRRALILLGALFILFLWHNLAILIHVKHTFSTDMNGAYFEFFSVKHFSDSERIFYRVLQKLTYPGALVLPIGLWLFFFFRTGAKEHLFAFFRKASAKEE